MSRKIESDQPTIEALKAVTGFDVVRTQVDERADGAAVYGEGYTVASNGEFVFLNDVGQSCHVPAHRVLAELAKAEPKKADPKKPEGK